MNNNPVSTPKKDFLEKSPEELGGESKIDGLPSPEELGVELEQEKSVQTESEQETNDNFFSNVGSTLWNVASKQIPATLEFMKSAVHSQPRQRRGQPIDPTKTEEEFEQEDLEARKQAFKNASQKMQEFQESQAGKVTQVSDIGDGVDLANYIGNTVAQAGVQIPASIFTGGGSSVMQEVGLVYMDQIEKIAEKEGIEPEEVIDRGLDDRASAAAYGTAAGILDFAGAKGVTKTLPFKDFKNALGKRAISLFSAFKKEAATEGGQSIIEQFGGSRGAGDSIIKSLTDVDINEVAEEAVAGGIGGTGVNTAIQATNKVKDLISNKKQKLSDNAMDAQARAKAEQDLFLDMQGSRDRNTPESRQRGDVERNQVDNPFVEDNTAEQKETTDNKQQNSREKNTPKTITVNTEESKKVFVSKFREWFLDRGNLPKEAYNRKLQKDQNIEGELQRMRFFVRDLNKAMDEEYNPKGAVSSFLSGEGLQAQPIPKEAYDQVNEALRGNIEIEALPDRLQEPARKMRSHIDRLSNKLIEAGVVEGKMGAVIDENIGVYMNRSYRLHDDPNWANKVPSDIRNQAKSFLRDQYESQGIEYTEQQIDNLIDDILYSEDAPIAILSGGMEGSKDLSILKQREDIAPEIRALMGEYTDPIVNYSKSVYKMANLLESHKYLTNLRDQGMGTMFFEQNDPNRPEGFNAQVAADGSNVMSPLNGLYTTPEIKDALEESFKDSQPGRLAQWYLKANSAVKYGKTVGSVTTHLRNLMGGMGFAIANGHTGIGHFQKAVKQVRDSFLADDQISQERVIRLKKLGILADGANVGEMKGYLKDANFKDPELVNDLFSNIERNKGIFSKGRKLVNTLTNLYQAEDNLLRLIMFESEVARYQEAMPELSKEQAEELAADIISRTYQNYNRVPKVIEAIRKIPVVGTFASFPAEVIRTSINTAIQAKSEMANGNKAVQKIGWRRAAGLSVQMGIGTAAAQAFSQAAAGVLEDEDEALRRFMPPWSRNSSLFYTNKTNNGARYMNMSYTDPHEYLKKPVNAIMFGEDAGSMEAISEGLREMFEPFLGEEILFRRVADIRSNSKSPSGSQIYNPQASLGDQAASAMGYLWEAFEPGTITQGKRLVKGYQGVTNDFGKKYNVSDEVLGFFGMRISEVDVEQSLKFKGFDYSKQISNARRLHTKHLYNEGNVSDEVLEGSRKKANMALQEIWKEAQKDWDAAYKLGVSSGDIKKSLKEGNLPKWFIKAVDNGRFKEFDFD